MERRRVLLVDMCRLPREILRGLLEASDMEVAGEIAGDADLVAEARARRADLVIVGTDVAGPQLWRLLEDSPEVRVLAIVCGGDDAFYFLPVELSAPLLVDAAEGRVVVAQ